VANRKPTIMSQASEKRIGTAGEDGGIEHCGRKILLPGVRRPGVVAVSMGAGIVLDPLTTTLAVHTSR